MFSPLAVVPLQAAEVVITVITFLLLGLSTWIVLTGLRVWPHGPGGEPASVRRAWLAAGLVAAATIWLEPIQANFSFGQINAVLMTLVIADCVPRRTPWPRGVLLGIAIALKLTPAVFLLYFLLRRDARAALTALASFVVATLLGFALAWRDSVEYWTTTVRHTDRIGTATLNTNQNAAGALARLGLGESAHFLVWTVACLLVLALTVWAARRVSRADEPELVLICVALFGLVVSPVSWSHHWVWALPTVLVLGVLAYRRRNPALAAVCVAGVALMVWPPLYLLPEHHEASAAVVAPTVRDVLRVVGAGGDRGQRRDGRERLAGRGLRDPRRRLIWCARGSNRRVRRLLERGGVDVDVLLTGQLHQFVHHLVDDGPFDEAVAGHPVEPGEVHRLAECAR